ncbi:5-formyltetrahydrofolate cyclo-ligase [Dictyocaulus viviparus]|uniref:5-formyltetrahydrofolate cyclo-ligase n=1 Tax=Dictyocaulus viviparus TaxID=29172 RepID=A0A0D8Y952_DICVI|nr:5-formyltetrahydrofolate cyclo-ligase [Dictyocaulus viviparus]
MRVSEAGWQLIPVWIHCISMVTNIFGIVAEGEDCVEKLIELLFRCDNAFDAVFATTVQLFHRTWREMHASHDEHGKVANVVHEQLCRAANHRPSNLKEFEELLLALPYWKMKELWKRDLIEKENNQMNSEVVSNLRNLLKPSIEQLIRTNRKNHLKKGFTFKRQVKGKTPHKGENQYCFWRLDASDLMCFTETDVDPYVEGVSHVGNVRKVAIKDILSVDRGEDITGRKSTGQSMRCIRIVLHNGDSICGATFSEQVLSTWMDGLSDLVGGGPLSHDAQMLADRMLNIELRLRLLDVPNPQIHCEIPPLPDDFSWVKPEFFPNMVSWYIMRRWLDDILHFQKKQLRSEIHERLYNLSSEEVRRQSDIVIQKVLSSEWFKNAQRISVFLHTYGEIETDRIVKECLESGKQLFVPQFFPNDSQMRMLRVPSLYDFTELKPAFWGIRQPTVEQNWENYEDSGPLDVILVPGKAFTLSGDRLGHGKGYYDRALAEHKQKFGKMPILYGLALQEQIVDTIPMSKTDVRLDGVIRAV